MTSDFTTGDIEQHKKRARYRAWHRGILEMDQILGAFADARLPGFEMDELTRFERLMEQSDTDLLAWITGVVPIPSGVDAEMVERIKAHQISKAAASKVKA